MSHDIPTPSEEELALLSQLVYKIAQTRRLPSDDAQDFAQTVQLRLLETGYAIFHRFEGKSSLKTYLTIVVTRLFKDWQNQRWGKWRPSAAALRLGDDAVRLERLMERDGFTLHEAIEILLMRPTPPLADDLRRTADLLPRRQRRRMMPDAVLRDVPGPPFEDPVDQREKRRTQRRIEAALHAALAQLTDDDRRLIEARYQDQTRMSVVAASMGADVTALYRRCDRVLKALRRTLRAAGVIGPGSLCSNVPDRQ